MKDEQDPGPFIICKQCMCMSFNAQDVSLRRCSFCRKLHADETEYSVYDPALAKGPALHEVFHEFLDATASEPKSG